MSSALSFFTFSSSYQMASPDQFFPNPNPNFPTQLFAKPLNPFADPFHSLNAHTSFSTPSPFTQTVFPGFDQTPVAVPYVHGYWNQYGSPVIRTLVSPNPVALFVYRAKVNPEVEPPKEVSSKIPKKKIVSRRCVSTRRGSNKWIRKTKDESAKVESNARVVCPFPSKLQELKLLEKTTVMIKNVPNQFCRRDLLRILSEHCRDENRKVASMSDPIRSEFDFVYLPVDFRKYWGQNEVANLGYAFVNFTSPTAAWRFFQCFNGLDWSVAKNNKICEVVLAKIQGIKDLESNFISKVFYCPKDELPAKMNTPCDGSVPPKPTNVGRCNNKVPPRPPKKSVAAST